MKEYGQFALIKRVWSLSQLFLALLLDSMFSNQVYLWEELDRRYKALVAKVFSELGQGSIMLFILLMTAMHLQLIIALV